MMNERKYRFSPMAVAIPFVMIVLYCNLHNCEAFKMNRRSRKEISLMMYNDTEAFLIQTPGCTIPNYMKYLDFKETTGINKSCYERVVFVERSSENVITFRIDYNKIVKQKEQCFNCTYRFVARSKERGKKYLKLMKYKPFNNGDKVKLEEEVIQVSCNLFYNKRHKKQRKKLKFSNYNDAYLILKKKPTDTLKTSLRDKYSLVNEKWNVLIVGMDTMSRGRVYHSMPKTAKYLQENSWLDYRGYQKIASNTFPNMMAILTGKNATSTYKDCGPGMDHCEYSMIWNKFKEAGYMTAYGEDNLCDTFFSRYGFSMPPTDHYARPLFHFGVYHSGNILCTMRKTSAQHLLDYALQFSQSYKNDNFFGHFWISSFSHDEENLPTLIEDNLISLFESLKSNGSLNNTFVFFISDHGIRFGHNRLQRESYYEERLPMLFMWVPYEFQETYPVDYNGLRLNQFRLTTPYDFHATLFDIMTKTNHFIDPVPPEACPKCHSLTTAISRERTCEEVGVDMKWCSCHGMTETSKNDMAAKRSLELAVEEVQNYANTTKTTKCTVCSPLNLTKVYRNDWYKYGNKTYYVVAFEMQGDATFEATVEKNGNEFRILSPTETITSYNSKNYCVVGTFDSPYCVCKSIEKCILI